MSKDKKGVNFQSTTDCETIAKLKIKKNSKGSHDVVGIRLLGIEPDDVAQRFQDHIQWTPLGCFTKQKRIAKTLINLYDGVYIDNNWIN